MQEDELAHAISDPVRLEALRRTALLDSPPEEAFDRLTRAATVVVGAPIALVTLLDSERHFFKSQCGLPEPYATSRETPLTHSFCKHVVGSHEPLIVSDVRTHPLFSHRPLVEGSVLAYAGFPLITSEGQAIGTFCVIDWRVRQWTRQEIESLGILTAAAMSEIDLRRAADELRILSTSLEDLVEARTTQLRIAEDRQRHLLAVNNAIVTCLDRDALFTAIAGALEKVIPYDRAALILHDPGKDTFQVMGVAVPASVPIFPLGTEWPRRGSRSGWILDHRRAILTVDLREEHPFVEHAALIQDGILSAVSVPLTVKGRILGTLHVGSRLRGRYGEADLSLLSAIAEQVALALENLLAYEEIAALKARLEAENRYLQEEVCSEAAFGEIVGESAAIRRVLQDVRLVAGTDSTVLVTGETGTGKELVVRGIHGSSRRKDKILVKVNCAALPASVIESELFGHEKGAFTGALARRVGRFELANRGTLFLDEVGDLPLELQAKLLRVLQEGEFERVGGTQTIKVDVRVIAATNRDLLKAVAEERFRADLYYRLNVFPIVLPPLRQRPDDIPRLARHFAMLYASKMGRAIGALAPDVLQRLAAYPWPGNVRELQNVIERAVILSSRGRLELDELTGATPGGATPGPAAATAAENAGGPARSLEAVERDHILSVLERTGWRVSGQRGAAALLGLKRTTLEARMKKLGIQRRV